MLSLFAGRILYRLTVVYAAEPAPVGGPGGGELPAMLQQLSTPWTAAILFVLLGYYLGFYTAVLIRGNKLTRSRSP